MGQQYKKPFLTISEQVEHLAERGLDVESHEYATSLLQRVGYYRLSGYWHLFRELKTSPATNAAADEVGHHERRESTFVQGSALRTVHKVYELDRELRMRVFDALEMVEVALRFRVGHILGRAHAYAHRDPSHLLPDFTGHVDNRPELSYSAWLESSHAEWLSEVDREEKRSSETFVAHFKSKYGGPLPVWVVTEILSFGTLSRLFSGMERAHKDQIAAAFGIINTVPNGDGSLAGNWLNHLRYIRNTCAHHARLWNKNITVQLAEPNGIPELAHLSDERTRSRVYGTLAVLAFLTERIQPGSLWRADTIRFLSENIAEIGLNLRQLGFPEGWDQLEIWQTSYTPSHRDWDQKQQLLDQLKSIPAGEAGRLLRPEESAKKRLDYVRYLRGKGHLLGLRLATAYEYPEFQFDPKTAQVHPVVSSANSRLLGDIKRMTPKEVDATQWAAARWWATASSAGGSAPAELIAAGELTQELLDKMLPPSSP